MPSDIMMFHAAAARKQQESRMGLDVEQKRAAFRAVQRKDFRKPSTARKRQSRAIRKKTLANYKENQKITPSKPVTRFKQLHKAPVTKDIEIKPLDYSAVEAQPKAAKVTQFHSSGGRTHSRLSEFHTFISKSVDQKVNADYILGHGTLIDNSKAATILEEGTGTDVGSYIVDQAGCGAEGPAILGPSKFDAEDGATIMPQGRHSRQSDVHSHITATAGCGAEGPAILGPSEFNPEDGATIMPQGKHSRQSDVHSHMTATAGCGAEGPAILGPSTFNPEDGATIMPQGRHSRQSDVHSHMTATAGCGAEGPAILGPSTFNPEDGATIMPEGRHSRMSDVHSYITQQAGCGAERTEEPMDTIEEAPVEAEDDEALSRARAETVESAFPPVPTVRKPSKTAAPTDVVHVAKVPPPLKTRKRFTCKNINRMAHRIQLAFAPKIKTKHFVINF